MTDCDKLGDCEDSRLQRIYEYLDGELSEEDLAAVKDHLDACPDCASQHDLECVIRAAVKRSCEEAAPTSLKDRIIASIDAAGDHSAH
ncbi:mycothiol system anti-sigma-R factor [Falsarthrobacter nasiphocae]|uniref:Anti-sigma factor (TIGR02949 family) n=1 Tax=Falsarthrobacter nasiphocae TaxID=189863 RepID=A0AAE3YGG0_9MICC|nr:mycothiol system anti-sigma-R factor [Falsarthrobacter nasiphocae]MDR6892740.1 anti-sigma factor (TIGR02949 family) [Falsarthrobacter nasiphocae]